MNDPETSAAICIRHILLNTVRNPFHFHEYVFYNEERVPTVCIDITASTHNKMMISLNGIRAIEKRLGHASTIVSHICSIADQHSINIELTAKRYGNPFRNEKGMDTAKLRRWYERYSFNVLAGDRKNGYYMVRKPKI